LLLEPLDAAGGVTVGEHALDHVAGRQAHGRLRRLVGVLPGEVRLERLVEQLAGDHGVLLGRQQRDRVALLVAQVEVHERPLGQERQRHGELVGVRQPQALTQLDRHREVDRHVAPHLLVAQHRERLDPPVAPCRLAPQQRVGGGGDVARPVLDLLPRPRRHGADGLRGRGRP
jgi:hypothetical protein